MIFMLIYVFFDLGYEVDFRLLLVGGGYIVSRWRLSLGGGGYIVGGYR